MVQGLSESAAKDVLCSAAEAIPALILNIMEKFQEETAAKSPEPGPAPTKPSWCICNNCRETLPEDVRVCCGFRPNLCQGIIPVSIHVSFANSNLYHKLPSSPSSDHDFRTVGPRLDYWL